MKRIILALAACSILVTPALAQGRGGTVTTGRAAGGFYGSPYAGNPYAAGTPYIYGNPYAGSPYGSNPLFNPIGGGYYANPWVNPYGSPYMYNGSPINSFGAPISIGGGFYGMTSNGHNFNFWRAPSGYYYPWTAGYGTGYTAPIVVINNGASPQPAQPPLSTVFSDTLKYLDEQKAAGKLSQIEYTHLKQRALDLLSKERDLRTQGSGSLDQEQENSIRADVDSLGGEIARSVKP